MDTFEFVPPPTTPATSFNGIVFYKMYKDSEFLRIDANIRTLLSQGYQLRKKLNTTVAPGGYIPVPKMFIEKNTPLLIKRTGTNIKVEDFEFTYNRLIGVVAAFAYENRERFPSIECSEAKVLGLQWDNQNDDKCRLYLSAVTGTEHMVDQFSFWPLLCALRKYQLNKMPIELVVKNGNIKCNEGVKMVQLLKQNLVTAKRLWLMFAGTSLRDLQTLIEGTPKLKKMYEG